MTPALAWGLFARLLAIIYVVGFGSILAEIEPLAGSRGITPIAMKLARMRADMGTWRALSRHPTLLWLSASDAALRALPIAGGFAALLAACGLFSIPMLGVAWVCYSSGDVAVGLTFPWESMLLEAGFLALLLPPLEPLPSLRMSHAPEPLVMFAFHWLLFRVLFGFGKTKFTRLALQDPVYLRGFLISQPIPSPLGWRAARLPRRLLVWAHTALGAVEIVLPFLIFFPGWPRLAAAGGFSALMIGIQAMGNFGFFNILTIVLCVTLLDPRPLWAQPLAPLASPHGIVTSIAVAWSLLAGLFSLPFNTWVARGWPEWPMWAGVRGAGGAIVRVLRAAMPFRTVHAYGVFPPRMGPPIKLIPVAEGTLDGVHWEPFECRYMPTTERSAPRFVAPHTPRVDHFALYEGVGLGGGNYLGTIFSQGNPYDFAIVSPMDRLLERLMDAESPVRRLFGTVPFGGAPPIRMRTRLYLFVPTTPAERAASGRYWTREFVGMHAPERGPDPHLFERWLPAPEQFHPDERWARRRVPRLAPLLSARSLETVQPVLDARAAALWDAFWSDVVPAANRAANEGWPAVIALARRMAQTDGPIAVTALDRIRGAVATALLERMEPHVLALAAPRLEVRSNFHASLAAHALILGGRDGVDDALASGRGLLVTPPADADARGLMLITLFSPGVMTAHARSQRVLTASVPAGPPPAAAVPGFPHVMPLLADALPDPDQRLPVLAQRPDGEWTINGVRLVVR